MTSVMEEGGQCNHTVEDVFSDFKGRRFGLIKALTSDVEEFYQKCDPERENLCLYGLPCGQWEVNFPVMGLPPKQPEPELGINFPRDQMQEKHWLAVVSVHSNIWLLSLAFYFGAKFGFDKADREQLFNMINDLPTIYEVVIGASKKKRKERSAVSNLSSNKSKTNSEVGKHPNVEVKDEDDGLDEEEEELGDTLCGACGGNYASDEFWVCCDICERWFHGKCMKITPAMAEQIKQYKCASCSSNKKLLP